MLGQANKTFNNRRSARGSISYKLKVLNYDDEVHDQLGMVKVVLTFLMSF